MCTLHTCMAYISNTKHFICLSIFSYPYANILSNGKLGLHYIAGQRTINLNIWLQAMFESKHPIL